MTPDQMYLNWAASMGYTVEQAQRLSIITDSRHCFMAGIAYAAISSNNNAEKIIEALKDSTDRIVNAIPAPRE